MGRIHTVKRGEYLGLIARSYGFADWRKIYNHPDNAEFKRKRPDPDLIRVGDTLIIPETQPTEITLAPGRRHRFRLRRPPPALKLAIATGEGEARGGHPYTLRVQGRTLEGTLNPEGLLERTLPGGAREAELILFLDQGREQEMSRMLLKIGELDPLDEVSGVQARLNNLGFHCGSEDGRLGPKTRSALKAFQQKQGLDATGEPDTGTLERLREAYGC